MLHLVNSAVDADCLRCAREGFIERGLLDVGTEAIDRFQPGCSVYGEQIGSQAYICAVLLVCTVEREMSRAFVGVVSEVYICDLCEERARVGGQRVEGEAVDNHTKNLESRLVKFRMVSRASYVKRQRSKKGGYEEEDSHDGGSSDRSLVGLRMFRRRCYRHILNLIATNKNLLQNQNGIPVGKFTVWYMGELV